MTTRNSLYMSPPVGSDGPSPPSAMLNRNFPIMTPLGRIGMD